MSYKDELSEIKRRNSENERQKGIDLDRKVDLLHKLFSKLQADKKELTEIGISILHVDTWSPYGPFIDCLIKQKLISQYHYNLKIILNPEKTSTYLIILIRTKPDDALGREWKFVAEYETIERAIAECRELVPAGVAW